MASFFDMLWRYAQLIKLMDIVDVALVAFVLYKAFTFMRDSSGTQVLRGVVLVLLVTQVSSWIGMHTLNYVLSMALQLGAIAVVIIFQPELRRILEEFGRNISPQFFMQDRVSQTEIMQLVKTLTDACTEFSAGRVGALIIVERETKLSDIINSGTKLGAAASVELLHTIFYPGSPLHDGAVIIRETKVASAACVLPLSSSATLSRSLGTRHRAGVGMSENSDAVCLIVSEETGAISVAIGGMLKRNLTPDLLTGILTDALEKPEKSDKPGKGSRALKKGGERV